LGDVSATLCTKNLSFSMVCAMRAKLNAWLCDLHNTLEALLVQFEGGYYSCRIFSWMNDTVTSMLFPGSSMP
jgi:hypothetical protein